MYERGPGLYVTGHRVFVAGPVHLAIEFRGEDNEPKTLSAGPGILVLVSERNRKSDVEPGSNFTIGKVNPPGELSVGDYFDELIKAQEYYCNCLDYDLFPREEEGYNSNSYVRGILEATGGSVPVEFGDFVGGGKPVPAERFRPPEALDQ